MNGLEEVCGYIKNFICEKNEVQKQIVEIENKRTQLAGQRNIEKANCDNIIKVNELGKQITKLGNQSQALQNQIDSKFHEIKAQINLIVDSRIAEGIRGIRKINDEIQELETNIENQRERKEKYQLQKQEFYVRFGRMPELSENAIKENKFQEEECENNKLKIDKLEEQIKPIEEEISLLAKTKREFKNGNWKSIIEREKSNEMEELVIEPLEIEEMENIEEIFVEEFDGIEEIYIEPFEAVQEIDIETFAPIIENKNPIDEIEELARSIVEEIVAEQTMDLGIDKIEEEVEDIITFEKEVEKKEKVIIPLFGQRATISSITIKIEDGQLVYNAQMSDDEEIKIYPAKLGEESVLLRDKQNRSECKEILLNYAMSEYKVFDKKVINKIDPLVCELLIECAERYGFEPQELIYNYAMSFSKNEQVDREKVPSIIYNLSSIEQSQLTKKEKAIINKICRDARKNIGIDLIESFSGFRKIKYLFKRLFAINNVKVLPEAKY